MTPDERDELHSNPSLSFKDAVLRKFDSYKYKPEDLVEESRVYFKRRYEEDKQKGKSRPSHWLNSCSSALTGLKADIKRLRLAPYKYTKQIAITKSERLYLEKMNFQALQLKVHDMQEIDAKALLRLLYKLLDSDDPADLVIAVAGLTGRRQAEVTHSMHLAPPRHENSHRYPSFWAYTTGFIKVRKGDKYGVKARELPLLAPRARIWGAVRNIRDQWPSDNVAQASSLYAHKIGKRVKQLLVPLGVNRLHDLRRTFAQMAYRHFNERNSVLPAFASFCLGHKGTIGSRVMTYLLCRIDNFPDLDWILCNSGADEGVCAARPEKVVVSDAPVFLTPVNTDSDEEDEEPEEYSGNLKIEMRGDLERIEE